MITQTTKTISCLNCLAPFLLSLFLCGCNDRTENISSVSPTQVADSPENRHKIALQICEAYPTEEWLDDIIARVRVQIGDDATEAVLDRTKRNLTEKKILEKRVSLLTDTFDVAELSTLHELLKKPAGNALWRKLYLFDDKVKESISPQIMAVLNGK